MDKCCCNSLHNQIVNSEAQFEKMKDFFNDNNYKSILVHRPYYSLGWFADKWYKCRSCGRVWEFIYPDFPAHGRIRLIHMNIVMSKNMIILFLNYNPIRWTMFANKCKRIQDKETFIPNDIYSVVSHYFSVEEWVYSPLVEINNYKPIELVCCIKGRILLKSYLLKKIHQNNTESE